MLEKIVYVVGSPRSGSSLIYNAICSHNIFNPAIPENHLATNLTRDFYSQYKRNIDVEGKYFFESAEDTEEYFKTCLEIFFKKISEKYHVNKLILKSITLTSNINILHEYFADIFYIMTIRDPRDIVVSMLNVGAKQEKLNINNQFPRNMKTLCDRINTSYRLYFDENQKKFLDKKVCLIKYEDFVSNSIKILNKAAEKLAININYQNDFNIWNKSTDLYQANNKDINNPYKSNLWGKDLNNSRIGIYKEFLNKEEIETVNEMCKKIIDKFEYE